MNRNIWLTLAVSGAVIWVLVLVFMLLFGSLETGLFFVADVVAFGLFFGGAMGYISTNLTQPSEDK